MRKVAKDLVQTLHFGGVALVVIDNPPVNSLTNRVLDALTSTANRLATLPDTRAVVLAGAGDRAFAAGADIDELSDAVGSQEWVMDHTARSRRALASWEKLPKPVVAAVQASAVGGGLELALVCDLIVADQSARFELPEVRLGLIPGAGGTQRLPRRIGLGRAKEFLLLGQAIDAEEACRLGLVNRVAEKGKAVADARALAEQLADLPALSLRSIKRAFEADLEPALDRERELFVELWGSSDAREGISAFVERRIPVFRHE